jgi:hypothetical protein
MEGLHILPGGRSAFYLLDEMIDRGVVGGGAWFKEAKTAEFFFRSTRAVVIQRYPSDYEEIQKIGQLAADARINAERIPPEDSPTEVGGMAIVKGWEPNCYGHLVRKTTTIAPDANVEYQPSIFCLLSADDEQQLHALYERAWNEHNWKTKVVLLTGNKPWTGELPPHAICAYGNIVADAARNAIVTYTRTPLEYADVPFTRFLLLVNEELLG